MALRNQPYFPLYVQDYLTDEKLNMCSLSTQGVYIKILCILHKQSEYGKILLKQKEKQSENICLNFATKFARLLPITISDLELAIAELIEEDVLQIFEDTLSQRRMIKDNGISEQRAKAGKKGGETTQFAKAKREANTEDVNEDVNEDKNKVIPAYEDFKEYALSKKKNISIDSLQLKYDSWVENGWRNGNDKPIKNWKTALLNTIPYIKESDSYNGKPKLSA